jgi:hypothetical protein
MTNTLKVTSLEPMRVGKASDPHTLPGTEVLGYGIGVFGPYCASTSHKQPIIDNVGQIEGGGRHRLSYF